VITTSLGADPQYRRQQRHQGPSPMRISSPQQIETPRLDARMSNNHPDILTIRHNVARWLNEAGRTAQALAAFEHLLVDRLRVLGPDDPDNLSTRASVAVCLGEAGRTAESIAAFEQLR
jgi:hypothetical protein